MDAKGNHPAEWLLFGLFPGEARCLSQTWKRMKMEPGWGILEGGPAREDRGVVVLLSPQVKLIPVRFPDG